MRSVHRIRLTFTLLGALALSGCLDDDGGSGDDTSKGQLNFNGFNGLSYQTASQSGTTNAAGEFRYYPGETLTFRVGDLPLVSGVPARQYVTLLEFFETTRTELQTPMVDDEGLSTHTLTEQQVLENTTLMNLRALTLITLLPLGGPPAAVTLLPFTAAAQGVPVVDTQNIAQNIQQLRQMIEDEILQNEQLLQLREQLTTLTDQLAELQRTYEALTRLAELPEVIRTEMEDELNGLLDQEFGDIQATIRAIRTGDFSGLTGSGAAEIETQMDRVLAELGFDDDTLREMATSGNAGAERIATQATTGALVSAAAQNSYDDAGQSLERVERLVGLIDDMDELKESVDLNTRVTAELAIALVAMWQLEAVQTVGDGTGGVIDAATIAEEQNFMEFTIPDLGD